MGNFPPKKEEDSIEKELMKLVEETISFITLLYENEEGYFSQEGYLEFGEKKEKFILFDETYDKKLAEFTPDFISSVHPAVMTVIIKEK